jgi:hypothetical protein
MLRKIVLQQKEERDMLAGKPYFEIISEPGIPGEGIRAAMILHNGAPVELIEFKKNK